MMYAAIDSEASGQSPDVDRQQPDTGARAFGEIVRYLLGECSQVPLPGLHG